MALASSLTRSALTLALSSFALASASAWSTLLVPLLNQLLPSLTTSWPLASALPRAGSAFDPARFF